MAAAYYRGFSVAEIDSDGFVQPVVSITLDVHDVATASFIDTVTVDANGIVAEGSFGAAPGDVVEFSHGSYPKKFRQTLTDTQDQAYLHPDNNTVTFILDNSYASTNEVTDADLYAQDLDDMGQRPQLLGTVKAGETTKIPYQTSVTKNLRLMLVSKDNFGSQDVADFAYAQSEDLSVPALAPGTVTSVAMTVPSFLSVSGSPITGSGTLAVTLANQTAKTFLAGPTSGGAAAPAFRVIEMADLGTGSPSSSNFLRGDGSWQSISLSPAGSDTQVQFNDGGSFGGDSGLTYNKTTDTLTIGNAPIRSPSSSTFFCGNNAGAGWTTATNTFGMGAGALSSGTLTGSDIVAIGNNAGKDVTSGIGLTFIGTDAGQKATNGTYNTFIGSSAGFYQTNGSNTFIGVNSGRGSTGSDGYYNTGIGNSTLINLTSGYSNTAVGRDAGAQIQNGTRNAFFGSEAGGNTATNISACVFIGYQAGYNCTSSDRLFIANSNTASPLIYGEFDTNTLHWNATKVRQKYDGSNYYDSDVSSAGVVTLNAVGSGAKFVFSDAVEAPSGTFGNIVDDSFDTTFNNASGGIVSLDQVAGFKFNTGINPQAAIGDWNSNGNGTYISIDDLNELIFLTNLPTADPGIVDALYRDGSGNVKISI